VRYHFGTHKMQIFGAKLWFVATSSAQLCHSECVASIEMCGLNEHAVVVMDQEYFTGLEAVACTTSTYFHLL
jgi:hypothetical protein